MTLSSQVVRIEKGRNSFGLRLVISSVGKGIIQMRCEENRVFFRSVSPFKTSQRCPRCTHTQRENRKGEEFECPKCGYAEQADYAGPLNILHRFLTGRYGAGFKT